MLDVNDVLRQAPSNLCTGFMSKFTEEERNELFEQLGRLNAIGDTLSNAACTALTHNVTTTLLKRATPATGTAPEAVEEETEDEMEEEMEGKDKLQLDGLYELWKPFVVHTTLWRNPDDKQL